MNTRSRRALVLVFDRLNPGFLGPYGNTWVDTPAANHLAAQSTLYEFALTNSPHLDEVYHSYWTGNAHGTAPAAAAPRRLAELLSELGCSSELLADDPDVLHHADAAEFSDRLRLEVEPPQCLADDLDQTQLAQFFAAAIERTLAADAPDLLWCHSGALNVAWDAPRSYRERFVESGDPPPLDICQPVERDLTHNYDPDELLGVVQAYAGQIAAWDACLAALLEAVAERAAEASDKNWLVAVTSPRGYPLGEHLRIGPCDQALYGELLHVPLFLWNTDGTGKLERRTSPAQPHDLFATLLRWFGGVVPANSWANDLLAPFDSRATVPRELAWAQTAEQMAIRTPAWFYRKTPNSGELFAKPDDRWEVNELARRCPEVVEQLDTLADSIRSCTSPANLPPLSETLRRL